MEGKRKLYINKGKFNWQYGNYYHTYQCGDWKIKVDNEGSPDFPVRYELCIPGTIEKQIYYSMAEAQFACETHRLAEVIGTLKDQSQ